MENSKNEAYFTYHIEQRLSHLPEFVDFANAAEVFLFDKTFYLQQHSLNLLYFVLTVKLYKRELYR